jgi:hypothetical protein
MSEIKDMNENMKKRESLIGNKKAAADLLLSSIFRIGFMMVALLAFFLMISFYMNNKIDPRYLQAETFKARLINSDAMMYRDPVTSVVHTGWVDMEKMRNPLDNSIDYGKYERHVAAKVKILSKPDAQNPDGQFIIETYYNKDMYENWKVLIKAQNFQGKESATMYISEYPVTCYYNIQSSDYCTMVVEVIVPNS